MKTLRIGKKEFTVFNEKEMEIVKKMACAVVVALDEQIDHNNEVLNNCIKENDTCVKAHLDLMRINSKLEESRNEYKLFLTYL